MSPSGCGLTHTPVRVVKQEVYLTVPGLLASGMLNRWLALQCGVWVSCMGGSRRVSYVLGLGVSPIPMNRWVDWCVDHVSSGPLEPQARQLRIGSRCLPHEQMGGLVRGPCFKWPPGAPGVLVSGGVLRCAQLRVSWGVGGTHAKG
eukprot:scaffold4687_cov117-Isochrysis_galbana.AAC.2